MARAAFEDALRYAQERESFGKPIWQHHSVGSLLADMATQLVAAQQLVHLAARRYDLGERTDLEAGMAELFASEAAAEITLDAIRCTAATGCGDAPAGERRCAGGPLRRAVGPPERRP